jgi:hypothetical protein
MFIGAEGGDMPLIVPALFWEPLAFSSFPPVNISAGTITGMKICAALIEKNKTTPLVKRRRGLKWITHKSEDHTKNNIGSHLR